MILRQAQDEEIVVRSRALTPAFAIACLRGRVMARKALVDQAEGDSERLAHQRAIAEYEAQIEALCAVALRPSTGLRMRTQDEDASVGATS